MARSSGYPMAWLKMMMVEEDGNLIVGGGIFLGRDERSKEVPEDAGEVDFELALTQTASLSYKSGGADSAVEPQQEKSMSDNDNESGVSGLGWFLAGLGIGALVGVLYAPKAGKETREELVASALDARDRAAVLAQQAQDKAADLAAQGKQQVSEYVDRGKEYYDRGRTQWAQYVEKGKGMIQEHQNKVSAAIDAGKDAYASTTSEPTS